MYVRQSAVILERQTIGKVRVGYHESEILQVPRKVKRLSPSFFLSAKERRTICNSLNPPNDWLDTRDLLRSTG